MDTNNQEHRELTPKPERRFQIGGQSLYALIANFPVSLEIYDLEGNFLDANKAWERLWGLSKEETQKHFNIFTDEQAKEKGIDAYFRQAVAGEQVHLPDLPYDAAKTAMGHGRKRWLSTIFFPIKDEQGEVLQVVIAHQDITEKKELSQQVLQAQKIESIGRLAGGIAHDINNILTPIYGISELLMLDKAEDDPDCEDLILIQHAVMRAADLLKQVLSFSHRSEANLKSVEINQQIEKSIRLLERTLPKSIEIKTQFSDNVEHIVADATQLEQIMLNLLINAKDAMSGSGEIIIRTGAPDDKQSHFLKLRGLEVDRYIVLSISDNGPGIAKEVLPHIFDPFYTTKEVDKGTGLGLATVYNIVTAHNGFIQCLSEPGEGASFEIFLPKVCREPEQDNIIRKASMKQGSSHIMVVDDDPMILEICAKVLRRCGHDVFCATRFQEALALAQQKEKPVDLLITDFHMPGKNGHEMVNAMREINPKIKVLMISGNADSQVQHQIDALKTDGFINKPFGVHGLMDMVNSVLNIE